MRFTLLDIAACYDRPLATTYRHVQELKQKGLFEKKSPGKHFNEKEAQKLSKLMDFELRKQI